MEYSSFIENYIEVVDNNETFSDSTKYYLENKSIQSFVDDNFLSLSLEDKFKFLLFLFNNYYLSNQVYRYLKDKSYFTMEEVFNDGEIEGNIHDFLISQIKPENIHTRVSGLSKHKIDMLTICYPSTLQNQSLYLNLFFMLSIGDYTVNLNLYTYFDLYEYILENIINRSDFVYDKFMVEGKRYNETLFDMFINNLNKVDNKIFDEDRVKTLIDFIYSDKIPSEVIKKESVDFIINMALKGLPDWISRYILSRHIDKFDINHPTTYGYHIAWEILYLSYTYPENEKKQRFRKLYETIVEVPNCNIQIEYEVRSKYLSIYKFFFITKFSNLIYYGISYEEILNLLELTLSGGNYKSTSKNNVNEIVFLSLLENYNLKLFYNKPNFIDSHILLYVMDNTFINYNYISTNQFNNFLVGNIYLEDVDRLPNLNIIELLLVFLYSKIYYNDFNNFKTVINKILNKVNNIKVRPIIYYVINSRFKKGFFDKERFEKVIYIKNIISDIKQKNKSSIDGILNNIEE